MVAREWAATSHGNTCIEIWHNKIRHLRHFLKRWARNQSSVYKKEKQRLLGIIDHLDIKAETTLLSEHARGLLREANDQLANLRRDEESKWAQRAKVKHIQEGGNNTKYFHLIANGKHRRKKKFQLEQDEGTILGQDNIKNYITEFYKSLFGAPVENIVSMIESMKDDISQLSQEEPTLQKSRFMRRSCR